MLWTAEKEKKMEKKEGEEEEKWSKERGEGGRRIHFPPNFTLRNSLYKGKKRASLLFIFL